MKVEWKSCFRAGISIFLLYLCIYYWQGVSDGIGLLLAAAGPLVVGCVIAYLINIPMSIYERCYFPRSESRLVKRSRRIVCMLAAMLTLLGIIGLVVGLVIPELLASIQELIEKLKIWFPEAMAWIAAFVADSDSLAEIIPQEYLDKLAAVDWEAWISQIIQFLSSGIGGVAGTAVGAITSVFSSVVSFICGLIFALYMLLGKDRLLSQANRLMKNYLPDGWRKRISHVCEVLNDCFHRYVVGQCTEAVILGGLCMLGMWIFRFPYATMIGTLVGFTALIPVAGAYIGAVVGAFMILTVSPLKAVLFLIFLVVLQQIEGNLIYPRVVGSSLGLPGMWVLAAVTVGGGLLGIPGMLIGVPLVAAVYRLLREDVRRREGKERAAETRKRREKREKKYLKDVQSTPKLKGKAKSDMTVKQDNKAKVQSVAGQNGKAGGESPVKHERVANGQISAKKNNQKNTQHTSGQENKPETQTVSGGNHSHRRRRRHKSTNSIQRKSE